ncbi:MAG: HAMP domain-containing protein [Candidatus Aureabacteria bacterium]|nr:HAMP domain-containing protein [Candidatus Auribacterota bacterium]MCK5160802.1 HAMP domain-containing protein [Candidatus Auribacterota bacterium]
MKALRIGPKLISGFAIYIILSAIIGTITIIQLARIKKDTIEIKIARDIEKEILECRRQEKNVMLFGPHERAALKGIEEKTYLDKVNDSLIALKGLVEEGKRIAVEEEFNVISREIESYEASLREFVADYDKGEKKIADHSLSMRKNARSVEEIAREAIGIVEKRIDTAHRTANGIVWRALILAIIFGSAVAVFLSRNIINPIRKLTAAAALITGGDLSQRIDIKSDDEIGELSFSFNKMTEELEKSRNEIASFSKGLEEKVQERTAELSILYEVSSAISHTLDYQTLLKIIMKSLFKIVDYDICASLLFDAHTANITLKSAYPQSAEFANEAKNNLIDSTSALTGENIRGKHFNVFLIPTAPDAKPEAIPAGRQEERKFDKLRSFFNVPFVVRDKTIGMINVSSCKDNAFSEDDIKLIFTIANQASSAIERLQVVSTTEKLKMHSMVESMAEGVIMIDERGEVVVLNPQARRMLGFGPDAEVARKMLDEKMKVFGLDKVLEEFQSKVEAVTKEITIPHDGGAILHCDISPVKSLEGKIIGIVTILRDITREKEIDNMKTEFISTVSHELRTPLTTMKEFTAIISDEIPGKLTEGQREYVDIIKGNIDRLARLINNLLDISKIESGRAEFKRTLVNITDLANSIIFVLKPEIKEKHIEIKTLLPDSAVNIYADPDKIIQVFTNLIENAIKFTPENGKITVEIKDTKKEIKCSVDDTGTGIAPEDIGKLFDKFQQFGRVPGAGGKGTGLGLSITKELVEAHNGRIWADSRPGRGSKFTFILPKNTDEEFFREYVKNGIKNALEKNSKMSLLVVFIKELEKFKKKFSVERFKTVLEDIESLLNACLRGSGDIVFNKTKEVAAILPDCNKIGVLKIESRLKQALDNYLVEKKLAGKVELGFGHAVYPDDAKDEEKLIEKAKKG